MSQAIEATVKFGRHSLELDVASEVERIVSKLRESVHQTLCRQGVVLGISGGIDSSVVLALCVRAFGPERVVALLLPEGESSPDSATLAQMLADYYDVQTLTEDISGALEGFGCYHRRNEAIQNLFPDFGPSSVSSAHHGDHLVLGLAQLGLVLALAPVQRLREGAGKVLR